MRLPLSLDPLLRPADHIGEVVEASTTGFVAQCLDPDDLSFPTVPALGSWVRSQDDETGNHIYGVVCHASIVPVDAVHRVRALGLSPDQLRDQQPQIFAMLRTDFQVAIVGFATGSEPRRTHHFLPPRPPQIHQPVYRCADETVAQFCQDLGFLRTLLQVTGIPSEELMAAVLRHCHRIVHYDRDWLVAVGQQLSVLLRENYDQLRAIVSKLSI
ncbi:MAG: hypothetical protein HC924_02950 [Synechococcaceae cyanobacterium SM2_3_2]|nr:hypothetical protein [Synechococcaceae cyanobacterium SM2_3_2]